MQQTWLHKLVRLSISPARLPLQQGDLTEDNLDSRKKREDGRDKKNKQLLYVKIQQTTKEAHCTSPQQFSILGMDN